MYKRGGRIKFLPRGASKYTPPPPSPGKCLLARNGGGGGGVYNFSLETSLVFFCSKPPAIMSINAKHREPASVGLPPTALWRVPPIPLWRLEDPSLKPQSFLPPSPSSCPHPLSCGRRPPSLCGVLTRRGVEGEALRAALGARPTSGGTRKGCSFFCSQFEASCLQWRC